MDTKEQVKGKTDVPNTAITSQEVHAGLKSVTPAPQIKGLTFIPVPQYDAADAAFGAGEKHFFRRHDLPEVPRQYEDKAAELFYSGGKIPEFADDIDRQAAVTALRAWLSSFAPSHEAKMATAGYALWVWSKEAGEARKSAGAA